MGRRRGGGGGGWGWGKGRVRLIFLSPAVFSAASHVLLPCWPCWERFVTQVGLIDWSGCEVCRSRGRGGGEGICRVTYVLGRAFDWKQKWICLLYCCGLSLWIIVGAGGEGLGIRSISLSFFTAWTHMQSQHQHVHIHVTRNTTCTHATWNAETSAMCKGARRLKKCNVQGIDTKLLHICGTFALLE
jgi:hypothetical protein